MRPASTSGGAFGFADAASRAALLPAVATVGLAFRYERLFDAPLALQLGLANYLVSGDELLPFCRGYIENLARTASPTSIWLAPGCRNTPMRVAGLPLYLPMKV